MLLLMTSRGAIQLACHPSPSLAKTPGPFMPRKSLRTTHCMVTLLTCRALLMASCVSSGRAERGGWGPPFQAGEHYFNCGHSPFKLFRSGNGEDVISQVRAADDRAQPSTLAWHRKSSWNNATSHKLSTLPEKQRKCSPGSAASLLASVSFLHVSLLAGP